MYATAAAIREFVQCEVTTAESLARLASVAVDGYVRRSLLVATYTETLRATDGTVWVVPAGWSLTVDSVTYDGQVLTVGDDYRVEDGAVVRIGGPYWRQRVTVSYSTGFDDGSPELGIAETVCLELAARAAANPQHLQSFNGDGASLTFVPREGMTVIPPLTLSELQKQTLDPLRWRRRMA